MLPMQLGGRRGLALQCFVSRCCRASRFTSGRLQDQHPLSCEQATCLLLNIPIHWLASQGFEGRASRFSHAERFDQGPVSY